MTLQRRISYYTGNLLLNEDKSGVISGLKMVKTRSAKTTAGSKTSKKASGKSRPVKSQDVYDAIAQLQERGGSRAQDVLKYLKANSKGGAWLSAHVKVALARGVKQRVLVKKGNAYKLHPKVAIARAARSGLEKKSKLQKKSKVAQKPKRVSAKSKRVSKPRKKSKASKGKTSKGVKKPRRVSAKKVAVKRVSKPRKAKTSAKKSQLKSAGSSNKLKRSKEFIFRRSRRFGRAASSRRRH